MRIDFMTMEKCRRELKYAKDSLQKGYELYMEGDFSNAMFYINSSSTAYEWVYKVGEVYNDEQIISLASAGILKVKEIEDEINSNLEVER